LAAGIAEPKAGMDGRAEPGHGIRAICSQEIPPVGRRDMLVNDRKETEQ
jgi:hypothetical protein